MSNCNKLLNSFYDIVGNEMANVSKVHSNTKNKNFYVLYGPSGSGKSTILNKLTKGKKFIHISVDNIMKTVLQNMGIKHSNENYLKYRGIGNFLSDYILNRSLLDNVPNIFWETTGCSIEWVQKEINRIRKYSYNIIVLYPIVSKINTINRVSKRKSQINPNINSLKTCYDNSVNNVFKLKNIDKFILYDNNEELKRIYSGKNICSKKIKTSTIDFNMAKNKNCN